jgi:hypothetical protein
MPDVKARHGRLVTASCTVEPVSAPSTQPRRKRRHPGSRLKTNRPIRALSRRITPRRRRIPVVFHQPIITDVVSPEQIDQLAAASTAILAKLFTSAALMRTTAQGHCVVG